MEKFILRLTLLVSYMLTCESLWETFACVSYRAGLEKKSQKRRFGQPGGSVISVGLQYQRSRQVELGSYHLII